MTLEDALRADREGDLVRAAFLYEEFLSENEGPLFVLVNLAVLYWQATDPGMAAALRLEPGLFAHAGARFPELLAQAERLFPSRTEPRFWRKYIAWADLGEPFDLDECRELLDEEPSTLVPALFRFPDSQGKEAVSEALELLEESRSDHTTRSRYVVSVLDGYLRRNSRR